VSRQWKEVVRLAFRGDRFRDHALDLSAITEMGRFQNMIAETAKALWYADNPQRQRLPARFEERTRLCLRRIEEASAAVPLEVYLGEPEELELSEREPVEANQAVALACEVLRAAERDEPLPDRFPRTLIPEYERFGQGLTEHEAIQVIRAGEEPARVTPRSRARLAALAEGPYEDHVDVTGQVLEADIRQGRFQVWLDDGTGITACFSPPQESEVIDALRGHRTVRLQVIGRGEFSASGKPLRVTEVEEMRLHPVGEVAYDSTARPIEEVLAELAAEVPEEDWRRLPPDLTDNLDHYLYGTPRR